MTLFCSVPGCQSPCHNVKRQLCRLHYRRWQRHGDPEAGRTTKEGEPQKFFAEVVLACETDECLFWPFGANELGYGRIWRNGKHEYVHRLALSIVAGPPPELGMECAHSCGNGHLGCCNPRHLRWATSKQNSADMFLHGTILSGEQSPTSRLTAENAAHIRTMKGRIKQRDLAAKIGVSQTTVSRIQSGQSWQGS
jgi:hypothetical protein